MSQAFQMQFATYFFPNLSFEVLEHPMDIDTPVQDIRRRDGGVVMDGFLRPKTYRINGKIYGEDSGSVHAMLNNMKRSLHNGGAGASLFYMADRYAFARLAPGGFVAAQEKGLYGYLWNVDALMVADPFVEALALSTASGSRTNNSSVTQVSVGGNYPASPIITFIAGTWNFGTAIRVDNNANSLYFEFFGGLLAGKTLVVDCAAGCVLMHVGMTMVDALSLFGGHLPTFVLEPGGNNDLVINAPSLSFSMMFHDRYYV